MLLQQICYAKIDGTDFRIYEPEVFSPDWYSHKFKGPGLRYEIGVALNTGDVVWINGPFRCGEWTDIKIFRDDLIKYLDENERVEADDGYSGENPEFCLTTRGFAS